LFYIAKKYFEFLIISEFLSLKRFNTVEIFTSSSLVNFLRKLDFNFENKKIITGVKLDE